MSEATHLAGQGAVAALERKLREHFGMPYAVAFPSATAALLGIALALDLRNEPFVTTPYTWGGTLAGWLLAGNRPRFADIEPLTLGISPDSAAKAFGRGCRALLAVDVYGVPCRHDALAAAARAAGAWYILDAAQSLGAFYRGAASGFHADAAVVSFTHGKAVDAGEGGAVVMHSEALYRKLIWHTQHPLRQKLEIGTVNEFAMNGRIHPAAAASACAQFDAAIAEAARRRERSARVYDVLEASGLCAPLRLPEEIAPSYYRLTASWKEPPADRVRRLEGALSAAGFDFRVEAAPVRVIYRQPAFRAAYAAAARARCPEAERQVRLRFCIVGPGFQPATGLPSGVSQTRTTPMPNIQPRLAGLELTDAR